MNPDNFLFATDYPIDKVVHTGEVTIVNNGATSGQTGKFQESKVVQQVVTVPTDEVCFVRFVWSIDGGSNWQSSSTHLWYGYNVNYPGFTAKLGGVQGAVSISVGVGDILVRTINGSHGNVTVSSGGSVSYTPIPRTFIIKYALYALE